jgi:two-component system OmpR family response regulator
MAASKGRTILLVEDDPRMLRIYTDALSSRGHTVIGASDPREVGGLLSVAAPALILLDIMMPEIDGIELCRRARLLVGDKLPIIFLTALNDVETIRKALAAGGNDYILKGGSLIDAVDRVESWLARSRMPENTEQQRAAMRALDDMATERAGARNGAAAEATPPSRTS